jgi:hypothetical protein
MSFFKLNRKKIQKAQQQRLKLQQREYQTGDSILKKDKAKRFNRIA